MNKKEQKHLDKELMIAVKHTNPLEGFVENLLRKGANPDSDLIPQNAFAQAIEDENIEYFDVLMQYADPKTNVRKMKCSPFEYAYQAGKDKIFNHIMDKYIANVQVMRFFNNGWDLLNFITLVAVQGDTDTFDKMLAHTTVERLETDNSSLLRGLLQHKKYDEFCTVVKKGLSCTKRRPHESFQFSLFEDCALGGKIPEVKLMLSTGTVKTEDIMRALFKINMCLKSEMYTLLHDYVNQNEWRLHETETSTVARYTQDNSTGYGCLEIFNFAAGEGERTTIMHNLTTRQESLARQDFNDISDKKVINLAKAKLIELGGELPPAKEKQAQRILPVAAKTSCP